jgi:hypothetical protein
MTKVTARRQIDRAVLVFSKPPAGFHAAERRSSGITRDILGGPGVLGYIPR